MNKEIPQLFIYGKKDPVANFGKDIRNLIKKQNEYDILNQTIIEYLNSKHEILFHLEKSVCV